MRLDVLITDQKLEEDPLDHRSYIEYVIQVQFNGEKTWSVRQKYRSFCQLHESLINQYPSVQFPQSSYQFAQRSFSEFKKAPNVGASICLSVPGSGAGPPTSGGSQVTDRRNILQSYLQDLLMIPAIKESNQLKAFLGIKDHFPEFYNEAMEYIRPTQASISSSMQFLDLGKHQEGAMNLKDFALTKSSQLEDKKSELLKFITGPSPKAAEKLASHQKQQQSRSNMRYQSHAEWDEEVQRQAP
jgi:hypothetical protein